jgi:hypothetical protein
VRGDERLAEPVRRLPEIDLAGAVQVVREEELVPPGDVVVVDGVAPGARV